jgi:hypothetical protein
MIKLGSITMEERLQHTDELELMDEALFNQVSIWKILEVRGVFFKCLFSIYME